MHAKQELVYITEAVVRISVVLDENLIERAQKLLVSKPGALSFRKPYEHLSYCMCRPKFGSYAAS